MKQNSLNIFLLIILAATCSSCNQEEGRRSDSLLRINAHLENDRNSRAIINEFSEGCQIGLLVQNAQGNNYHDCDCSFNVMASLAGGVWTLNQNIEIDTPASVYSYYPYQQGLASVPLPVEVASQTDYLYGQRAVAEVSNSTANIYMKHGMALNSFLIKKNSYTGSGKITKIEITNVRVGGVMNIITGEVTPGVETGKMTVSCDVILDDTNTPRISIIMIPAVLTESNEVTAKFTIDGEVYTYEFPAGEWKQGKDNVFTLSINPYSKELVAVGVVSIEAWGKGGAYDGDLMNDKFQVDVDIQK